MDMYTYTFVLAISCITVGGMTLFNMFLDWFENL